MCVFGGNLPLPFSNCQAHPPERRFGASHRYAVAALNRIACSDYPVSPLINTALAIVGAAVISEAF